MADCWKFRQSTKLQNLPVLNPAQYLPKPLTKRSSRAKNWDVLQPSAERQELDTAIYDALGLPPGEREAVQAGVTELVGNRKRRARSAGGGGAKSKSQGEYK